MLELIGPELIARLPAEDCGLLSEGKAGVRVDRREKLLDVRAEERQDVAVGIEGGT